MGPEQVNLRRRFSLSARLTGSAAGGARSDLECSMASRFETAQIPSSFLTSLMNRQSVPVAMILSGDDLIMPSSRSRSA